MPSVPQPLVDPLLGEPRGTGNSGKFLPRPIALALFVVALEEEFLVLGLDVVFLLHFDYIGLLRLVTFFDGWVIIWYYWVVNVMEWRLERGLGNGMGNRSVCEGKGWERVRDGNRLKVEKTTNHKKSIYRHSDTPTHISHNYPK